MSTNRSGTAGAFMLALALGVGSSPLGAQQRIDLPGQDRAAPIEVQDLFTVGSVDGAEWESFGEVTAVDFGPDGNLYVLDGLSFRVVVLSPEGELVRTFGREGQGPGEFQMPGSLTVLDDGTVVVYDRIVRNFTWLTPEGEYIRSVPTNLMEEGMALGRTRSAAGRVLSEFRGLDIDTGTPATDPKDGDKIFVREVSGDGANEIAATLANPGARATFVSRPNEQNMRLGGSMAFAPVVDWEVLPDGRMAWIDDETYAVKIGGGSGTEVILTRPIQPRPVTSRDQNEEKDRRLEALEATGAGAPMRIEVQNGVRQASRDTEAGRRMIEELEFAEVVPAIESIVTDHEGRIWARRYGARVGEPGPIDLLDPSGSYLGTFELDAMPAVIGSNGLAAFIETGDFGIQIVRVGRVVN